MNDEIEDFARFPAYEFEKRPGVHRSISEDRDYHSKYNMYVPIMQQLFVLITVSLNKIILYMDLCLLAGKTRKKIYFTIIP